jgi:hypothetical protein
LMTVSLKTFGWGKEVDGSVGEKNNVVDVCDVENFFDLKTRVSDGMRKGKTVQVDFESLIGGGKTPRMSELQEKIMVNVKGKEGSGFWQTFDFRNIKDMMNISVNELRKDPKMVNPFFSAEKQNLG